MIDSTDYYRRIAKNYLPLLDSSAHSTILSTTSRTVLTQTFTNPSATDRIKQCIYTFPLYDGVSVVSFTCRIGKKVLTGIVKEKYKAKKIYDDAVAKGQTAGLLEQAPEASDVFSTKLGNIPAGQSIIVEITYIGELKHTETEGIRFTIPTSIAPRYGSGPAATSTLQTNTNQGIKITVDVNMPEGSFIKGVQSPSHPIAVSMGTISTATNADPTMSKASATLSLGTSALEKDFVLIVSSKDVGIPKALLETHPTIPNHRALMATLVPKFSLPPSRPEIVFVADQSGSMAGKPNSMLIQAMNILLKSIPLGVKFNICPFGSTSKFLWPKSQPYTAEALDQATRYVNAFQANMGGTETYGAIKKTIDRRFSDLPLEIIILTDGDIWHQEQLFKYLNEQVEETNGNIRVFPLGIGSGVSHSLIEGMARAGNGFASAVQDGERLDAPVVRMLRGALSPHITDYTLEVKYERQDDDFEVIEKVTEGMRVLLSEVVEPEIPKATISLFDTAVDPEKDAIKTNDDPHSHLPDIPIPHLHQAPHKIPSLFAFSRTSVYLLLSPETIQRNPTSVILRATSEHGPLALEIPIEVLSEPGTTIHQLAAKKAVQDLEEGRGWIYDAKDQNDKLIKERYPSCFQELIEKEAVRLGEKFQIAGKWTSFVAVVANDKEIAAKAKKVEKAAEEGEMEDEEGSTLKRRRGEKNQFIDIEAEVDENEEDSDDCKLIPVVSIDGTSSNTLSDAEAAQRYVPTFSINSEANHPRMRRAPTAARLSSTLQPFVRKPLASKACRRSAPSTNTQRVKTPKARSKKPSSERSYIPTTRTLPGTSSRSLRSSVVPDSVGSIAKRARNSFSQEVGVTHAFGGWSPSFDQSDPMIEAFSLEPCSPGYSPTSPNFSPASPGAEVPDIGLDSPDHSPVSPSYSPIPSPSYSPVSAEVGEQSGALQYSLAQALKSANRKAPEENGEFDFWDEDSASNEDEQEDENMTDLNSTASNAPPPTASIVAHTSFESSGSKKAKGSFTGKALKRSRVAVTSEEEIDHVLARGYQHEGLAQSSNDLAESAKAFRAQATHARSSNPFGGAVAGMASLFGSSKSRAAPPAPAARSASGGRGGVVAASRSMRSSNATLDSSAPMQHQRAPQAPGASYASEYASASAPIMPKGAIPSGPLSFSSRSVSRSQQQGSSRDSYTAPPPPPPPAPKTQAEKLLALISLQDFSGSWVSATDPTKDLQKISALLGFEVPPPPSAASMKAAGWTSSDAQKAWITMLVIKVLEDKMPEEEGTWGLVVEKARGWLGGLKWTDARKDLGELEVKAGEVVNKGWVGV